jgi:hypothetical protein
LCKSTYSITIQQAFISFDREKQENGRDGWQGLRVERTIGASMYEQDAQSAAWANMDAPIVLSIE